MGFGVRGFMQLMVRGLGSEVYLIVIGRKDRSLAAVEESLS